MNSFSMFMNMSNTEPLQYFPPTNTIYVISTFAYCPQVQEDIKYYRFPMSSMLNLRVVISSISVMDRKATPDKYFLKFYTDTLPFHVLLVVSIVLKLFRIMPNLYCELRHTTCTTKIIVFLFENQERIRTLA